MATPDDNAFAAPVYPPAKPSAPPPVPVVSAAGPPPSADVWSSVPDASWAPPPGKAVADAEWAPPTARAPLAGAAPASPVATRALVLALLGIVLTPVVAMAGAVTGRRVVRDAAAAGLKPSGRAVAALWIGLAASVLWAVGVAFVIGVVAGGRAG